MLTPHEYSQLHDHLSTSNRDLATALLWKVRSLDPAVITTPITLRHFDCLARYAPEFQLQMLRWACDIQATAEETLAYARANSGEDFSKPFEG